jgi:DNA-binding LytR/AlgR family response regulator
MNHKLRRLLFLIKQDAGLYLGISLGIFLFILFFQPFPSGNFDFNNWLLFVAGFAAIIYMFLILVRIFLRWVIRDKEQIYDEPYIHSGIEEFVIWLLCSVATSFYLQYVGSVNITFYITFKIILICLIPPLIVRFYDRLKLLKQENETLLLEKESLQQTVHDYEVGNLNKTIEFVSDNINENVVFQLSDIILVKSADNYVEIIYQEGTEIKRSIIRSTLKSVELQLKPYSSFIRCHRTAIVNRYHIQNINKKFGSYSLSMRDHEEDIPVSRQYLYKIKNLQ